MPTAIKTCPHCGGSACLNYNYSYRIRRYFVFVKCNICGAQAKVFTDEKNPEESGWTDEACLDAVKAWNMRHNPNDDTRTT